MSLEDIFFFLNVLFLSLDDKVASYHLLLWHFSPPKVIIQPFFFSVLSIGKFERQFSFFVFP